MGSTGQATVWIRPVYGFTLLARTFSGSATLQPNVFNLTSPGIRESLFLLGPDFRVMKSPKAALGLHLLLGGTYGIFDTDLKGVHPNTVGLYEEVGLSSWTQPTAVDKTEWINQIRTVTTIGSNYFIQESLHPNYWAQLALRSCIRQTYTLNRGGTCKISGTGLTNGEPRMTLN